MTGASSGPARACCSRGSVPTVDDGRRRWSASSRPRQVQAPGPDVADQVLRRAGPGRREGPQVGQLVPRDAQPAEGRPIRVGWPRVQPPTRTLASRGCRRGSQSPYRAGAVPCHQPSTGAGPPHPWPASSATPSVCCCSSSWSPSGWVSWSPGRRHCSGGSRPWAPGLFVYLGVQAIVTGDDFGAD